MQKYIFVKFSNNFDDFIIEIPHCAPANEDEVKTFVWVPDHQPKGGHCDPSFLVGELEEL